MVHISDKTHLRSQTLGQLSSSNERITWVQHPGKYSQHSPNTAPNDSFMHNQRITPFIPHSSLRLCLIICNLCSTTIRLTKHLSVTLLPTEYPMWRSSCVLAASWGRVQHSAALPGCLMPRTGCRAGSSSSRLWVAFLNAKTLLEKQLYFPQTGYYFPRQGIDQLVTHVCGCWLSIGYFGLTSHCLRPTFHGEARLNWDAPSIWISRMGIFLFLIQSSPKMYKDPGPEC